MRFVKLTFLLFLFFHGSLSSFAYLEQYTFTHNDEKFASALSRLLVVELPATTSSSFLASASF